ncbi:uncharacterized protein T551_03224 [Pneumocystis jirovecii RU7]|uniref:Signal recognition particle subunit SRP14 n=1 Tax=Pneumocystis jirovecii (strain RU7) TaxID=1408657 RepID=A0A0W4ZFS5_PNEJ7|nr:uncharacterized protein T551_03224 [Pneumocystis jirovecii RU7]KTW27230.1 hypothetical protein T551_03224 [Pneumocystis jirovecii RU7]
MLLSNEEYLKSLALLFVSKKEKGTIFLTQKRWIDSYKNPEDVLKEENETSSESSSTYKLLFRATDGKGMKISTLVDSSFLLSFFSKYTEICKSGMVCLKKRDRKKQRAKKNKTAHVDTKS